MSNDYVRILLVRHAESEGNVSAKAYVEKGDANVSITKKGCEQALSAGAFLEKYYQENNVTEWPNIFVSSYKRPQETLRGLYEGGLKNTFGGEPRLKEDSDLVEKFFGAASQMRYAPEGDYSPNFLKDMRRLSWRTYRKDPHSTTNVFGESTQNTTHRVKTFINTTLKHDIDEGAREFLIVTHGAIIQFFMMKWFHLPMNSKPQLGNSNNCDVIAIEGTKKNWKVTNIYDGEAMKPVNIDPTEGIERLTMARLPMLPYP